MIVKTKKYALEPKKFIRLAMSNAISGLWYVFFVPVVFAVISVLTASHVWWIIGVVLTILYILFWYIQFAGITQLEQYKMLFDRLSYEIDSRQIMIKLNAKQGMPLKWDQIKKVKLSKSGFEIYVTKAQIIYLPFSLFKNQNEIKFIESVLRQKGFTK
jgi:hypothetical protein